MVQGDLTQLEETHIAQPPTTLQHFSQGLQRQLKAIQAIPNDLVTKASILNDIPMEVVILPGCVTLKSVASRGDT